MITFQNLHFGYPGTPSELLSINSFEVDPKERILIKGASGSGKSTLLNLIAGILRPSAGQILIQNEDWAQQPEDTIREHRSSKLGFIFQDFGLLEYLNVTDNILLPYTLHPHLKLDREVRERVADHMETLDVTGKANAFPATLSFGEQQRIAIIRSVITQPDILLADEPTASLDEKTSIKTMELIARVLDKTKATFIMASHTPGLERFFDRIVKIEGGELIACSP